MRLLRYILLILRSSSNWTNNVLSSWVFWLLLVYGRFICQPMLILIRLASDHNWWKLSHFPPLILYRLSTKITSVVNKRKQINITTIDFTVHSVSIITKSTFVFFDQPINGGQPHLLPQVQVSVPFLLRFALRIFLNHAKAWTPCYKFLG